MVASFINVNISKFVPILLVHLVLIRDGLCDCKANENGGF